VLPARLGVIPFDILEQFFSASAAQARDRARGMRLFWRASLAARMILSSGVSSCARTWVTPAIDPHRFVDRRSIELAIRPGR